MLISSIKQLFRKDDNIYQCEKCGKVFIGEFMLNEHKKVKRNQSGHSNIAAADTSDDIEQTCIEDDTLLDYINEDDLIKLNYECTLNEALECFDEEIDVDLGEDNVLELVDNVLHEDSGTGLKATNTFNSKLPPPGSVATEQRKVSGRVRVCRCSKFKKSLTSVHNKKLACPLCHEMFTTMRRLDLHARSEHQGQKVHKCSECEKKFGSSDHLKRHSSIHSLNKPFVCDNCQKRFNRKDHLVQHQKCHNKTECGICHKEFGVGNAFLKHQAWKHGIGVVIEDKKFDCSLCSRKFESKKCRDTHITGHKVYKSYQCTQCLRGFFTKSHLAEHMQVHDITSRKFVCSECGSRFSRKDYLLIHMRRHTKAFNFENTNEDLEATQKSSDESFFISLPLSRQELDELFLSETLILKNP